MPLPNFISPGKAVRPLGAWLAQAGRLAEIDTVFIIEHFVTVVVSNPQIFVGEHLKPKSCEVVTDICIILAAKHWGILNWDSVFTNKVGAKLRSFKFILPRRGKTPAYKRDWAITLRDKASSVRNKMGLAGMYEGSFIVAPGDVTPELQRLMDKGFKVTVDDGRQTMNNEAVLKSAQMTIKEVETKVLSDKAKAEDEATGKMADKIGKFEPRSRRVC